MGMTPKTPKKRPKKYWYQKIGQKNIGIRKSSFGVTLEIFLIFGNLSLGDSYKKDSYKKVCNAFIDDWSMGRDRVECELVRGTT